MMKVPEGVHLCLLLIMSIIEDTMRDPTQHHHHYHLTLPLMLLIILLLLLL